MRYSMRALLVLLIVGTDFSQLDAPQVQGGIYEKPIPLPK